MKILAVASSFPHPNHRFAGVFTARIVGALGTLGHDVEVLCPRPYVPPTLGRSGRWRQYADIPKLSKYEGATIRRPCAAVIPGLFPAFWAGRGAWISLHRFVRSLNRTRRFDAVFAFDLAGAGGLAWRIAEDLRLPSAGWAFGDDVRVSLGTGHGRAVAQTINHLDLVFYQSSELRTCAGSLVGRDLSMEPECRRHVVLPHGIPLPGEVQPSQFVDMRAVWEVPSSHAVVLSVGRIVREKGVFDLLDAFASIARRRDNVSLIVVGAMPPRDDSEELRRAVAAEGLEGRVRVVGAVAPEEVSTVLSAADLFVFTSGREGMPNVVLEAMAAGVPTVVFDIPPLREADPEGVALTFVPVHEKELLAEAIDRLLGDRVDCARRAAAGVAIVHRRFTMRENVARAIELLAER